MQRLFCLALYVLFVEHTLNSGSIRLVAVFKFTVVIKITIAVYFWFV